MKTKEQKYREAVQRAFDFNTGPKNNRIFRDYCLNDIKKYMNIRKNDNSYDDMIYSEIRKAQ